MKARALAAAAVVCASLLARAAAAEIPPWLRIPGAAEGGAPDGGAADAQPPQSPAPAESPPPVVIPSPVRATPRLTWGGETQLSSPWEKREPVDQVRARWKSTLYGFVELDGMHDSTQSYGASSNNAMLARPGTYAALHGRTQMTANNSLFGFILGAPEWRGMKAIGHFEMDFFGVQPTDATEASTYTAAAVRMRLFYFRLKQALGNSSLELLAGQYHDLFAWGGAGFYPHSIAFLGIAGEVYRRQPQIRLTWSIPLCCVTIDVAAAAVRPVQRDSEVPDVQGGIKVSLDKWRGIGAQGFGQPDIQPIAIGVSGVWRRFAVAEFLPVPGEPKIGFGYGFAANAFLPIIPARSVIDRENALSLNGEVTIGTGLSDLYTGLTGGALFPSLPNPARPDAGAALPPEHRQRHRHVRRQRKSADDQLARVRRRAAVLPARRRRARLGVGQLRAAQVDEHHQPDAREQPGRRLLLAGVLRRERLRRGDARRAGRRLVPVHAPVLRRSPVRRHPPAVAQQPRRARVSLLLLESVRAGRGRHRACCGERERSRT